MQRSETKNGAYALIWGKLKSAALLFVLIVISEVFRFYTGISITIFDLILLPISGLLIYAAIHAVFIDRSALTKNAFATYRAWQLSGWILFATILTVMGGWLAWCGIQAPLAFFSGVKGSAHGYTVAHTGAVIAIYSIGLGYLCIYRLLALAKKTVS